MVAILVIAIVAFTSTNIDDFVLLTGLLADPSNRCRTVLIGHGIGIFLIIALSLAGAAALATLPKAYVLSLGFGPIFLGVLKFVTWLKRRRSPIAAENMEASATGGTIFSVTAAVSAAGGDNLAAYIPLFAAHAVYERAFFVVSFVVLAAAWCLIAVVLAQRVNRSQKITLATSPIVALLLTTLGIYSVWSAAAT